eukprot:7841053-Pyramimonas_sp.AAC.1
MVFVHREIQHAFIMVVRRVIKYCSDRRIDREFVLNGVPDTPCENMFGRPRRSPVDVTWCSYRSKVTWLGKCSVQQGLVLARLLPWWERVDAKCCPWRTCYVSKVACLTKLQR